jgi:hypothetical protein
VKTSQNAVDQVKLENNERTIVRTASVPPPVVDDFWAAVNAAAIG